MPWRRWYCFMQIKGSLSDMILIYNTIHLPLTIQMSHNNDNTTHLPLTIQMSRSNSKKGVQLLDPPASDPTPRKTQSGRT